MPMDPKLKADWIAALRSGEYKQGEMYLYNGSDGTFCCMGVLAVIQGCPLETIANRCTPLLPADYGWVGLSGEDCNYLANKNDGRSVPKHTFAQIADEIEERF